MTRIVALPHWWSADGARPSSWQVIAHGVRHDASGYLPGWDYETPLEYVSTVDVDVEQVRSDCGLRAGDRLALVAHWHASSTNRRELAANVPVVESGEHLLRFVVEPADIGGRLRLERRLVLVGRGSGTDDHAPHRPGSILWREAREECTVTTLERETARFPAEAVAFSQLGRAEPNALWWLDTRLGDLSGSPLQAMRLFLNAEHASIAALLSGGDQATTSALASVLQWDVARSLVARALDDDGFVEGFGRFEPDTVGAMLQTLCERLVPGKDAASLRRLLREQPARFEQVAQANFGLLAGSTWT